MAPELDPQGEGSQMREPTRGHRSPRRLLAAAIPVTPFRSLRSGLAPRGLTPLLPLAAILIALAVLPAEAQGQTVLTEFWTGTLTASAVGGNAGCGLAGGAACSSALTSNRPSAFTYGGKAYAITKVSLDSSIRSLQVVFDKNLEGWMQGVRLEVKDNATYRYRTFSFAGKVSGKTVEIPSTGLSWFAGEAIELRLLIPVSPPTSMKLGLGSAQPAEGGDVTLTLTLNRPAPPGGWAILLKVNTDDATASFGADWTMKNIAYARGGGDLIGGAAGSDLGNHGYLQVPGGLKTATRTITVHKDSVSDPGETIVMEAYYLGAQPSLKDTLTLTIRDIAPGAVNSIVLAAASKTLAKGGGAVVVTIALKNPAAENTTVEVTPSGTAQIRHAGSSDPQDDYEMTPSRTTGAGDNSRTVASFSISQRRMNPGDASKPGELRLTVLADGDDGDTVTLDAASRNTDPGLKSNTLTLTIREGGL